LNPLGHQAGNEMNVAAEAVELCHQNRHLGLAGFGEGSGQNGAAVEGVGTLAALGLDMLGDDGEPFGLGEAGDGMALGFNAKAG
jgi:hypothetical protein